MFHPFPFFPGCKIILPYNIFLFQKLQAGDADSDGYGYSRNKEIMSLLISMQRKSVLNIDSLFSFYFGWWY